MSECPKCGLQMGLHGSILPGCMCFSDTLVFKGHQLPPDDTALLRRCLEAFVCFMRFVAIHKDGPDASDKYLADDYAEEGFLKAAALVPALRERLGEKE